jgi:crossover junction endodeoxyribonuclease RuvC
LSKGAAPSFRVLGVDPGLTATGYGVIEVNGNRMAVTESGTIRSGRGDLGERLHRINTGIRDVIDRCEPTAAAFEGIFHQKNARSAIMLGHARAAAILAAGSAGLPVFEYTPLQVKQAVVGYGRAEKAQVQKMLPHLVTMTTPPDSADAADALAVAYCHTGHCGASSGGKTTLPAGMRRGRR